MNVLFPFKILFHSHLVWNVSDDRSEFFFHFNAHWSIYIRFSRNFLEKIRMQIYFTSFLIFLFLKIFLEWQFIFIYLPFRWDISNWISLKWFYKSDRFSKYPIFTSICYCMHTSSLWKFTSYTFGQFNVKNSISKKKIEIRLFCSYFSPHTSFSWNWFLRHKFVFYAIFIKNWV